MIKDTFDNKPLMIKEESRYYNLFELSLSALYFQKILIKNNHTKSTFNYFRMELLKLKTKISEKFSLLQ